MLSLRRHTTSLTIALLVLGCSATEHSTGPLPPPGGSPFSAGPLTGNTLGPVGRLVTTNSDSALVTGIPGEFTQLSYREPDSARLGSYIYFSLRSGVQSNIYRIGLNGRGLLRLTDGPEGKFNPSVSPDGRQVVYLQNNPSLGAVAYFDAFLLPHNGGTPRFLFTQAQVRSPVAWTRGSDTIVAPNTQNDPDQRGLYVHSLVPLATPRRLTAGDDDSPTVGTFGGAQSVLFARRDSLWLANLQTGDTTFYYSLAGQLNATIAQPQLSPDGSQLLFWLDDPSGFTSLYVAPTSFLSQARLLLDVDRPITSPFQPYAAWLPDGRGFVLSLPSADNPEQYQLYQADTAGHQRLITTLTSPLENGFSVGPAAAGANRELLGPDAALGDHASGILFGQGQGHSLASILALTANDPASVVMRAETGLNSTAPFLTVSLTADRLTSLRYLNALLGPVTAVVDSTSGGVEGALVTFNAGDGTVALVLTYGSEGPPAIHDDGAVRIFATRDSVIRLH